MTAERPPCIDGERCSEDNSGHLNRRDPVSWGWYCDLYNKQLKRPGGFSPPTRCAACRRDWPNEGGTK